MQSQAAHGVGLTYEPYAAFEEGRLSSLCVKLKCNVTIAMLHLF